MTLRRKLLIAFGGLAALALLAAAVTVYLTARWQNATVEMRAHYTRSLILQSVRAETFQALAEVNDALAGAPDDYADARADFERAIGETDASFAEWQDLAGDLSETAEVLEVRAAYERLTDYARQVFGLLDTGRREEAVRLVDDELDTGDYAQFQEVTELAVAADARVREGVTAAYEDLRITALIMSAVITIAALSLTFLIAAYLAQDLFQPMLQLRDALGRLAEGERGRRLNVDRSDEFGTVALAFNRAAEAFERDAQTLDGGNGEAAEGSPGQVVHAAAARVRSAILVLRRDAAPEKQQLLAAMERDADAVTRALVLGFPMKLQLAPLDPRHLAQEALATHAGLFAERGISCECGFEPEEHLILADRLRLREIMIDLLRDALAALPAAGGRIGLRVVREAGTGRLCLDVATSGGRKAEPPDGDRAERRDRGERAKAHVGIMQALVAEQKGEIALRRGADGATVTRLSFPIHTI